MTWLDLKLGLRMLVKYPGLALAGGAGIAVAVALAAGEFSVIYGNFMPSSLPLAEGEKIVSIELWDTAKGKPDSRALYDFLAWREGLRSIRELSAFRTITPNLILPGAQPVSIRGAAMSASGFGVARVRPLLGRTLEPEDEREGAAAVAVIGEDIWRDRLGSDPAGLGRTIQLGAATYSVVGVMPKVYAFPVNHHFWVPLRLGKAAGERLTGPEMLVFGRLAPGATLAAAQAELSTMERRMAGALPKDHAPVLTRVLPYAHPFLGMHDQKDVAGMFLMQNLCLVLLVLVCLNVAILIYTRTAMRQAEIGLRTALGASRARIVGQLFAEALVLSVVAAAAGVGIAGFALQQIAGATMGIAQELPFWMTFRLMPEAGLYAAGLAVVAAAIVGIIPGLQATRRDVQTAMRAMGSGGSGLRLGKTWTALIVAQVGFAVALLPPAVSGAWDDARDSVAGLGFAADEYVSARLGTDDLDDGRFGARQAELMRRLGADPRVAGVTFGLFHPGDEAGVHVETEGLDVTAIEARYNRVDVEYFRTFGIAVLAGRVFGAADTAAGSTVVVNQSFAEQVFRGQALGRRIRYAGSERWYEIVGIVRDFPEGVSQKMDESRLVFYHAATPGEVRPAALAARMRDGLPQTFFRPLTEMAADVDPGLYLRQVRGLDETMRREQWITRLQAGVFLAVTLSVLALASAGIYALMAFTVGQRKKEIGIRMALGADWKRIVRGIFSRALWQLGAGAALGMALGLLMELTSDGALMRGHGKFAVPAVAVAMMAVGFLAALGPARRCLRVEPTEALREQ